MNQEERVLGVATWGDPYRWLHAEYVADGKLVRAFSTLNILREVEKPVKILVIVLDTLAKYEDVSGAKSIDDIEEIVRDYVKPCLCGVEAEIVVLPGILKLNDKNGKRLSFESDPRWEFLPLLTYTVFEKAMEADVTSIALDVSHGINFMPTLALRAAEEAAAALAAAKVRQVRLKVYQSDPYLWGPLELKRSKEDACKPAQGDVEPPSLHYNFILKRVFEPWDLTRYTSYGEKRVLKRAQKAPTSMEDYDLDGVRKLLEEWALPLIGAFRLGALPQLALLVKAAPLDELREAAERAIECWKRGRKRTPVEEVVAEKADSLEVASCTKFAPGFWALVHARAVLEGARKLLGLAEGSVPLEGATVTLGELSSLRELVRGSRVVSALVEREISKLDLLKKQGSKFLSSEWVGYGELYRRMLMERRTSELVDLLEEQEPKPGSEEGKVDKGKFRRDFIAHAGFHTGILEVRLAGKGLEIRVRSDQWKDVSEVLREVTHEGAA